MICKNCNNEISDFSAFCPYCGMLFAVPSPEEETTTHEKKQLPVYNAEMVRKMLKEEHDISSDTNHVKSSKQDNQKTNGDEADSDEVQLDKLYARALQLERAEKIAEMKRAAEERARIADEIARKEAEEELKRRMAENERHDREVAEELVKEQVISREELDETNISTDESKEDIDQEAEELSVSDCVESEDETDDSEMSVYDDSEDYVFDDDGDEADENPEIEEVLETEEVPEIENTEVKDDVPEDTSDESSEEEVETEPEFEESEEKEVSAEEPEETLAEATDSAETESNSESDEEITEEKSETTEDVSEAIEEEVEVTEESEIENSDDDGDEADENPEIEEVPETEEVPEIENTEVKDDVPEDASNESSEEEVETEPEFEESEEKEVSAEEPEETLAEATDSTETEHPLEPAEEATEVDFEYVLEEAEEVQIASIESDRPVIEVAGKVAEFDVVKESTTFDDVIGDEKQNTEEIVEGSEVSTEDNDVDDAPIITEEAISESIDETTQNLKGDTWPIKLIVPVAGVVLAAVICGGYVVWSHQPAQQYTKISKAATEAYLDGDYGLAAENYTKLSGYGKLDAEMYTRLADAYLNLDRHSDAISTIKEALEVYPDNETLNDKLEAIYPTVQFSIEEGTYTEPLVVELDCVTTGIYYSLQSDSESVEKIKYEKPIQLDKNGKYTIEAYCETAEGYIGPTKSATYVIDIEEETEAAVEETDAGNEENSVEDSEFDVAAEYAQYPETLIEIQSGERQTMGDYSVFEAKVYHGHIGDKPEGEAKTETVKVSNSAWLHYVDYDYGKIPVKDAYVFLPYIGMLNATTDENGIITEFDFILGSQK